MTTSSPVSALSGAHVGHICDSCNRGVDTGDVVRVYAIDHETDAWATRWLSCDKCGDATVGRGTLGVDEVVVEAVFFRHQLASVRVTDRSCPYDGETS